MPGQHKMIVLREKQNTKAISNKDLLEVLLKFQMSISFFYKGVTSSSFVLQISYALHEVLLITTICLFSNKVEQFHFVLIIVLDWKLFKCPLCTN